ncbi:MAG: cupin domain-containing protein [Solirubrobacterales bacterium]
MDDQPRELHDNPVTGERVVALTDPSEHPDEVLVAQMTVRPGGRVAAAHHHPTLTERFLVLSGEVGFLLDGAELVLGAGEHAVVEPNVVHDWWQVGDEPADVIVEVTPGVRFKEMITTIFGLARDGKTNAKGVPSPPQLAVIGSEFSDVIVFETPPAIVQKLTIAPLAAIGRMRGLQPSYAKYLHGEGTDHPDPRALAELTPDGRLRPFD